MDARSDKWDQALCADRRDDTFFTDGIQATQRKAAEAIAICKRPCPILEGCLRYAIKHHPLEGIWGATTVRQRKKMIKQRSAV
jgi:WhiB family redox-sensing transcriptional regulator